MPVKAALQVYKGEGMDPGIWSPPRPHVNLLDAERHCPGVIISHLLHWFLEGDLIDFTFPSAGCFHGLPLRREHPQAYHRLLFMIWLKTRRASVLRYLLGTKEGQ